MSLHLSVAQAGAIGPRAENQDALRVVTPLAELAASKGAHAALDRCGGRVSDCEIRHGRGNPLPFGGAPGASLIG